MIRRIGALVAVLTVLSGSAVAQALPAVNMEAVLKAAQIDPRRADSAVTPGSGDSVRAVEQALADEGLLAAGYVDGHFGTKTVEAYAAFQRAQGSTGLDASGFPGRASLLKLGEQRFTVTRTLVPGAKVTYRGALMNARTKAMLVEAEGRLGRSLVITQGSYNPGGDPTSAGTHDGGGVLDISISGVTPVTVVRELRTVGFAAWYRTPSQGDWEAHIHAVALADPDLSPPAQHQGGDYYLGLNGLANRGPDDGPAVTPKRTWEEYRRAG